MIYLLVALFACGLTFLMTPVAGRLGVRLGLVDRPGGRRQHQGVIPRTGGLALFAGFFVTVLLTILLPAVNPDGMGALFPPRNDPNEVRRLAALLVGSLFCVTMGFLDDRYEFDSGPQYAIQFTAGCIAAAGLIFIKHVNNPLGEGLIGGPGGLPWWLVLPLTIFWFMGMMNTVNWLDGLSGLVAGVTAIFSAVLALHMIFWAEPAQLSVALLPLALLGTTLGFLPFNFAPARVFMGSSGSYFLGFVIAALGIVGGARLATVLFIIGLPALDVAWLIIQRRRRGVSVGTGGRDHLHFRLLDMGLSERSIVLGYWAFCAIFGLLTLLLDDRIYKLAGLFGVAMVGLAILVWASRAAPLPEKWKE
jgi:UDP-GlcNAc:undecaprenyl-phosphate GlcNAc-1-phosphate transferase